MAESTEECGICLDEFNDPRALDCLHTFCLKCIEEYIKKTGPRLKTMPCPSCRVDFTVPKDVTSLKKNFYLVPRVDSVKGDSCSRHGKNLNFLCNKCDVKICMECLVNEHNGHTFCKLNEEANKIKTRHLDKISLLKEQAKSGKRTLDSIDEYEKEMKATISQECKLMKSKLVEYADSTVSALSDTKKSVQNSTSGSIQGLQSRLEALEGDVKLLTGTREKIADVRNSRDRKQRFVEDVRRYLGNIEVPIKSNEKTTEERASGEVVYFKYSSVQRNFVSEFSTDQDSDDEFAPTLPPRHLKPVIPEKTVTRKVTRPVSMHSSQPSARSPSPSVSQRPLPGIPPSGEPNNNVKDELDIYPWYFGEISKEDAESRVKHANRAGAFLIRKSHRIGVDQPYTLVVFYNRVYNLGIKRNSQQKFFVGGISDTAFRTVAEMVDHYMKDDDIYFAGDQRLHTRLTVPCRRS